LIFIKIPGRIPSKKNSRMVYNGRLVTNKKYREWCNINKWLVAGMKRIEKAESVRLVFTFPDNRKTDLTNKAESVMDLLVEQRILQDDSWQSTGPVTLVPHGIDKYNPGVEIYIKESQDDEEYPI